MNIIHLLQVNFDKIIYKLSKETNFTSVLYKQFVTYIFAAIP
jgi:hypothetical protein